MKSLVLISILCILLQAPLNRAQQNVAYLSKERVYEDDYFFVDDFRTNRNTNIRFISLKKLSSNDGLNWYHGSVELENINHVNTPYLQLMLSALYLQPTRLTTNKRILFIGLGIGVLPRALFHLFNNSNVLIDVVEIDSRCLYIAEKFFSFKTTPPRLNVFIGDGYDYVMNLTNETVYDIIFLDAFVDTPGETCAPESFLTEKFVRKVHDHLSSNGGVFVANTVPFLCPKYSYERNLYHNMFGRLYMGLDGVNAILIAQKGKMKQTKRQIKSRVNFYRNPFMQLGTDGRWIAKSFNNFKQYKRNSLYQNYSDLFTHTFNDNVCPI